MNSVLTIGIASIVPGLGFWLLGQRRRAVIISLVVLSLFAVFWIVPSRLTWLVFFGAWVSQIYYAADTAQLSRKLVEGSLEKVIGGSSGLTKKDRGQARIRKIIQEQLFPSNEHILVTLSCFYRDAFGGENTTVTIGIPILRICYLGLTDRNLAVVELDFLSKPVGIRRIPLENISSANFRPGGLTRVYLSIEISGQKLLDFHVPRQYQKQAKAIVAVLSEAKKKST